MKIHFFILLIQIISLNCASHTIKNCEKLDLETNTCAKCKDKYFPLYHNLFCLPCDDKEYGQVGCEGNCDSSYYENDRMAYCEENGCKEGYAELMGLCINCSLESEGCKRCSMEMRTDSDQPDYKFSCEECLSDEYKMNENGFCEKCQIDHCLDCRFNNSKQECLECESDYYYISSDKTCKRCYEYTHIPDGNCRVCSDNHTDFEHAKCYCDTGYILNKNNTCSFYIEGCIGFIEGKDNNISCFQCVSGYVLDEQKCLKCPDGCDSCYVDNSNQTICTSCYSNYAFNSNNTCTYCEYINYSGDGCERCRYNEMKNKYECLQCYSYYDSNTEKYIYNYAFIKNEYKCLSNTEQEQFYLYGCLEANLMDNNIYECLKCKEDFISIINDKTCRKTTEINLSNNCLEAINIGNISNPIYSCNKCYNETVLITDLNNISNCMERFDYLAYCIKGKYEISGDISCIECISLAHLNEATNICQCDYDSFGINEKFCYKCDDPINGNPGCEPDEGCEYRIANNQLNCNKCKNNYFEFTKGQCYPCASELEFCNKCHINENFQFICDGCLDNFLYNKYEDRCELNCKEYPDISPGCIICNEEYKSKRKCNACKPGYFKTEDELCIYCRSEKYGGPACNKCIQNETDGNIICDSCEGNNKIMNSKGKCYFAPNEIKNECEIFEFTENDEKIKCIFCKDGFYLDNDGNCVNFTKYLEPIEDCYWIGYYINNLTIEYHNNDNIYYYLYNDGLGYYQYLQSYNIHDYNRTIIEFINKNLKHINDKIKGRCIDCDNGYIFNDDNKCISIKAENCSIYSMITNGIYYYCQNLCQYNNYPLIILKLNNTDNEKYYMTISEIYDKIYDNSIINLNEYESLLNYTLCIDNKDVIEKNKLKNCIIAKYIEKDNKYICHICDNGYFLYEETNECIEYDEKYNCQYENIGNITNPIYSCKECRPYYFYYYDYYYYYFQYYEYNESSINEDIYPSDYLLVKEGNISFCIYKDQIPDNCLSSDVDTTYIINKYNCSSCLINHLPYYSEFYERYICQSIFNEIEKSQDINLNDYQYYYGIEAINGECPNNTFFIDGYIESSEGICERCDNINYGCDICHYGEYPNNYIGIKRKRKFICDNCYYSNYILIDDECQSCSYIENGCNECEYNDNEFKCKLCHNQYVLDEEGHCNYCDYGFVFENKCFKCNDINNGGIEGCNYCDFYTNKTSCYSCMEGYVLLNNNQTCLKIKDNNKLIKQNKCREIYLKNDQYFCLECIDYRYSVLKGNDESICIYLPELNGYIDDDYFNYDDLYYYEKNPSLDYIYKYYFNRYINNYYFSHCVEVINLGSKDNPLYSCIQCYDSYYLYTEENSNISYCIYYYNVKNYEDTQNCKEKKIKIIDKEIKFTCISCYDNYKLIYHEIDKINYCLYFEPIVISETTIATKDIEVNETSAYISTILDHIYQTTNEIQTNTIKICLAKGCKKCKLNDEYFCDVCEYDNYVINNITGACMEKIETVPSIIWKDIFRLEMNSQKEINGKIITGPKLNLRYNKNKSNM